MLAEGAGQRRVAQNGDDLVGHLVDVPEVDLQRMGEDFGHARLLGDDDGHVARFGRRARGCFMRIDRFIAILSS